MASSTTKHAKVVVKPALALLVGQLTILTKLVGDGGRGSGGRRRFAGLVVVVRLESGEGGTELQNTLGGGKMQESGNAEGAGKRKCGRRGKAEMRKAECDRIMGRWMNGRGVTEEGRTDGRMDGRKDGRTDGRTDGWKEGRADGRKDGWVERRTDRRKDGRNVLRRCERLGLSLCAVPSLNGTVCVFLFGRVGVTERA